MREAAAELLSVRQQLQEASKGVAELSGQRANPNAPPIEEDALQACEAEVRALRAEQKAAK